MMAPKGRGFAHLEFGDAHGGLHADDFVARRQDIAIGSDAAHDHVQMSTPLAAVARLVVVDECSLVLLRAEMQ